MTINNHTYTVCIIMHLLFYVKKNHIVMPFKTNLINLIHLLIWKHLYIHHTKLIFLEQQLTPIRDYI